MYFFVIINFLNTKYDNELWFSWRKRRKKTNMKHTFSEFVSIARDRSRP